jgi:outer membrane immunogenic protein
MTRFLAAASALAVLAAASQASAADLAARSAPVYTKAPEYVQQQVSSWSGFYVGGNLGGAWSKASDFATTNAGDIFSVPSNIALINALGTGSGNVGGSLTGGVQLGYNWQVSPQWLIGIEADANSLHGHSSLTGSGVTTIGPISSANSVDANWMATFRARLGLTFGPSLVYVTGGAAATDIKYTQTSSGQFNALPAFGTSTANDTKWGWTVGAGWEQLIWGKWSVKGEYLFARFDGLNTATALDDAAIQNLTGKFGHLDVQIARVGLNYHFH